MGLASRERLERRLATALEGDAPPAVLSLAIDRFDDVVEASDAAADEIVAALVRAVPAAIESPYMLSRGGLAEFVLFLPDCDRGTVARVAGALIEAIEERVEHDGAPLPMTVSIGAALPSGDHADATTLIGRATLARDLVQAGGGGAYRFHDDSSPAASDERELDVALRRALVDGQFVLEYQPVVSAADGRIVGAEALLRWNSPADGVVPPNEFLPLLEENGQIVEVGKWVLNEAARQARSWIDAGYGDVKVSVNVSPRQILHGDLPAAAASAIESAGLPPASLELELGEGAALEDAERTIASHWTSSARGDRQSRTSTSSPRAR
jgi:predicted signal transduction protein with EAL and GGDEF domain